MAIDCLQTSSHKSREQINLDSRQDGSMEIQWYLSQTVSEESTTLDNLKRHRESILDSLSPTELFSLYYEFNLDEVCVSKTLQRRTKAEKLLEKITHPSACSAFLRSLEDEERSEHMGHRYIVSLLRGTEFATKEKIEHSKKLVKQITSSKFLNKFINQVNVQALESFLRREELLTDNEIDDLQSSYQTSRDKALKLLAILNTKGPTAYYIFTYRCLAQDNEHKSHRLLFLELIAGDTEISKIGEERKRKSPEDAYYSTEIAKRYPCFLESPEGLKTEQYLKEIRKMREYHLKGRESWQMAEEIYMRVMNNNNPPEMKIAILLESCTMYITDKQPQVVLERVQVAEKLCLNLHSKQSCNVDMLVGRCKWVLAKLYRYTKDSRKATENIRLAQEYLFNCEEGEERALVSYCHACILLSCENKTQKDEKIAQGDLSTAISCASRGNFGLDTSHCKIRLAQAHVGSSTSNTGKERKEVLHTDIREAKRVLNEIKEEELSPRTRCMLLYTWSDVLRIDGQLEKAKEYARRSLKIADEKQFKTEIASAELRQQRLKTEYHY